MLFQREPEHLVVGVQPTHDVVLDVPSCGRGSQEASESGQPLLPQRVTGEGNAGQHLRPTIRPPFGLI